MDDQPIMERRQALASRLLDDMERLRAQLFAPVVERKAVTVADGQGVSHVEIVDIELTEPTFTGKRLIVAAIAEAVTKVTQLVGSESDGDGDQGATDKGWAGIAAVPDLAKVRDAPKPKPTNARGGSRRGGKAAG